MTKIRLSLRTVAIAACLTVTMFASCKKDPMPDPVLLLEEISVAYGERFVFEYDDQDRIEKLTVYDISGQKFAFVIYKYNAVGDLEELIIEDIINSETILITLSRNGKIITSSDGEVIELNDQGFPVKYGVEPNIVTYTWENGNQIKEEWTGGGNTFTYYDDTKTPFFYSKTPKWVLWLDWRSYGYHNANNIEKITESSGTRTYEYRYNDDDLPIEKKGLGFTETYKYLKR